MDTFVIHEVSEVYRNVRCPRCNHSFLVDGTWPGGGGYIARPCPYCFKASRIPGGPALVYDSHETFSISLEQAESLVFFGLIEYSPQDGPNGIMYRPCKGVSMSKVRNSLA